MTYTLPRNVFDLLQEVFKDKQKSEIFARAIEESIQAIDDKARESIIEKKEYLKIELKEELKDELATKEFVRVEISSVRVEISEVKAEISDVRGEIKANNILLKVLIGLSIFGLTLLNPTFAELVKLVFS